MFRRIIFAVLTLLPSAALALPDAPAQAGTYTVSGALLDKVTKSAASTAVNAKQGLLGYTMDVHDDKYKYSIGICDGASLVETSGANIDPAAFNTNDTLVLTVQPNDKTPGKPCVIRVVRQQINPGSSNGECLQHFQVKHEIEDSPDRLLIKTEYVYDLTVYARPTLDCDAKAYGSSPITTVVAPIKPFLVTLSRNSKELSRWSLTTDADGKAHFLYTFTAAGDYQFKIQPAGTATAGDEISWDAKAVDPAGSPSPTPAAATSNTPRLTTAPILIVLFIVMLVAASAEYWHWVKRKRSHESPEQEYQRTPKL